MLSRSVRFRLENMFWSIATVCLVCLLGCSGNPKVLANLVSRAPISVIKGEIRLQQNRPFKITGAEARRIVDILAAGKPCCDGKWQVVASFTIIYEDGYSSDKVLVSDEDNISITGQIPGFFSSIRNWLFPHAGHHNAFVVSGLRKELTDIVERQASLD